MAPKLCYECCVMRRSANSHQHESHISSRQGVRVYDPTPTRLTLKKLAIVPSTCGNTTSLCFRQVLSTFCAK
jgi:hypothetical protein